jgi:hypothetical protein
MAITGVQPVLFSLEKNYPNPSMHRPDQIRDCQRLSVKLQIFDTLGGQTATLLDQSMNAGSTAYL